MLLVHLLRWWSHKYDTGTYSLHREACCYMNSTRRIPRINLRIVTVAKACRGVGVAAAMPQFANWFIWWCGVAWDTWEDLIRYSGGVIHTPEYVLRDYVYNCTESLLVGTGTRFLPWNLPTYSYCKVYTTSTCTVQVQYEYTCSVGDYIYDIIS